MCDIQMPVFETSTSVLPSSSKTRSTRLTLRERCGSTLRLSSLLHTPRTPWLHSLSLSFAPAFPNIATKGAIGPTAGNLPHRKRSSVVSLNLPPPSVDLSESRTECFA
ncbi:hypothetical protein DFH09DRAFT_1310020 [Mycena vulgaris]|nr:hypothetical protein DFH09DRAFT_1310020 [Mycena vulgaris]